MVVFHLIILSASLATFVLRPLVERWQRSRVRRTIIRSAWRPAGEKYHHAMLENGQIFLGKTLPSSGTHVVVPPKTFISPKSRP